MRLTEAAPPLASPEASPRRAASGAAPFDLPSAFASSNWRDTLAWPIPPTRHGELAIGAARALIDFLAELPRGPIRDAGVLAGPLLVTRAAMLMIGAHCAEAAAARALALESQIPEVRYLSSGGSAEQVTLTPLVMGPPAGPVRGRFLRRAVRMLSWTPWHRLPLSLLAPKALAVSHNGLLRDYARKTGARVSFDHAPFLFDRLRRGSGHSAPADVLPLAGKITDVLCGVAKVDEPWRSRLATLLGRTARDVLTRAAADMAWLGAWDAPESLWTGNGSFYPARALALEVLRRGGEVTGFAHGGGAGMERAVATLALGQLAAMSRFVVATPAVADLIKESGLPKFIAAGPRTQIIGHTGDPEFQGIGGARQMADRATGQAAGPHRRRTLYVSTALTGFHAHLPPPLPDPVHLDWQLRLAARLMGMGTDVLCQPHPEGLFRKTRHPLNEVAPVHEGLFEDAAHEAGLFLFDYAHSTTFWKALCTDKPVVFIDLGPSAEGFGPQAGLSGFAPGVAELIAQRCRVVRATYDHRNLPQVDWRELEDAVRGAPAAADGAPFRRLLAGED